MKKSIQWLFFIITAFYSCKEKVRQQDFIAAFEKKYPIHDNLGNYFETMPKVYTTTRLTKGISNYYDPNALSITYTPLWAEGKSSDFTEVSISSYQPSYEDTARVFGKIDYIYTKNIHKWKVKRMEWVRFEPVRWGDSLSPITKVTTFSHTRLVPLHSFSIAVYP